VNNRSVHEDFGDLFQSFIEDVESEIKKIGFEKPIYEAAVLAASRVAIEKIRDKFVSATIIAKLDFLLSHYDDGNNEVLLFIIHHCLINQVEIPARLVSDLGEIVAKLKNFEAVCLNDAFDYYPNGSGSKKSKLRKKEALEFFQFGGKLKGKLGNQLVTMSCS
jgi:hypothetical protein